MKKSVLILCLFPIYFFAQTNPHDLTQNVIGIITSSEGTYLVLDEGLIKIKSSDPYQEYYRAIYKDSTIINPNTELKDDFNLNIIPFLAPTLNQKRIDFSEPLQLGFLIQLTKSNQFNLTPYAHEIIDSQHSP